MSAGNNIPIITTGTFIEEVGNLYVRIINEKWPLNTVPAPFVWGPPGSGKSQGVYQISKLIQEKTKKRVVVTDIRLSMFLPIDLRGVPVADANKEFTVWLKPKIFALEESEDVINILFFDEMSSAPQQVQAAAYQITLDHCIGEHKLPENCIIIGAGNRTIDKSVVFRMPNALANRMQHYEIVVDYEGWKSWAIQNNVHPKVLGYLAFDNSKLCSEEIPAEQIAFPTPRTWMFVSNILWLLQKNRSVNEMYLQISACIGTDTAATFIAWCNNHKDLPAVEDIFKGVRTKYPAQADALYALIISMCTYVENREKVNADVRGLTSAEIDNMTVYASRFPADYQACLYNRLEKIQDMGDKLAKARVYREFKRRVEISI